MQQEQTDHIAHHQSSQNKSISARDYGTTTVRVEKSDTKKFFFILWTIAPFTAGSNIIDKQDLKILYIVKEKINLPKELRKRDRQHIISLQWNHLRRHGRSWL